MLNNKIMPTLEFKKCNTEHCVEFDFQNKKT